LSVDEISLTLPADDSFHRVAHLVLGGLAARLNLTYEHLEDLDLALETLLMRRTGGDDVTVRVRVLDGELQTEVGPLDEVVGTELARGADETLGLRRILEAVSDHVEIGDRDGGKWVQLTRRLEPTAGTT
jgi:hypothetical protein